MFHEDSKIDDLFTEAQFKFMEQEYQDAIELFTKVIELDQQFVKAWQARAIAHLRMDHKDDALGDIERAITIEPENHRLHYHKGAILFKYNMVDEAVEALSRAIELSPEYGPAYYLRSEIFSAMGEEEASSADFSKAESLSKQQATSSKVVDFWK